MRISIRRVVIKTISVHEATGRNRFLCRNTILLLCSTSTSRVNSLRVAASISPYDNLTMEPSHTLVGSGCEPYGAARAYCRPPVLHLTRGRANFNSPVLRGRRCLTSWQANRRGRLNSARRFFNPSPLLACVTIASRYRAIFTKTRRQPFRE